MLTQEAGYKAMQTQVIRYLSRRAGFSEPDSDAGYEDLAKAADEMPYTSIDFLQHLADVYDEDAFNISDNNFAEALRDWSPALALADFAHLPNPKE